MKVFKEMLKLALDVLILVAVVAGTVLLLAN